MVMTGADLGSVADDADDLARVAALVAQAGLPLTAAEIAALVPGCRYDRCGFDRLRAMLADEDEPAHVFQPARVMRTAAPTEAGPANREAVPNDLLAEADAGRLLDEARHGLPEEDVDRRREHEAGP